MLRSSLAHVPVPGLCQFLVQIVLWLNAETLHALHNEIIPRGFQTFPPILYVIFVCGTHMHVRVWKPETLASYFSLLLNTSSCEIVPCELWGILFYLLSAKATGWARCLYLLTLTFVYSALKVSIFTL